MRRAVALALGVLSVIAGVNTALVAAYAVDHGRVGSAVGVAAAAGAGLTVALVWSALRLWRRHDVAGA